jgi:hypothetical protein
MGIYEFHVMGGIEFMGTLFVLLLIIIGLGVFAFLKKDEDKQFSRLIAVLSELSLFALIFGVLGQVVGLVSAFSAIEEMGEVPMALLAGGLKVSSYTTMYGFSIFLIGRLIKIVLIQFVKK